MKRERILVAGSGGQGVIVTGKLLAGVAVRTVEHVTFFPAYGAEVRGGTSNCQIILSTREIASPVAEEFESMLLMNQASVERFLSRRIAGGLAILNSSLCEPLDLAGTVGIPATEEAIALGSARAANFVMLGSYVACRQSVDAVEVEESIATYFQPKGDDVARLNVAAFQRGLTLAKPVG